ncbi:RHS repeat-associated core domain-containing protein, partial [Metapseudomonas otitidis]|uniref:RHS repeat-associated core domain-containing protein n=1 Tax=Metapseudomonas otitidis TaxID=319939 RepID=UPI0023F91C66
SLPIAQIDLTYSAGTTIASTTLTYLHSDHLNTPRLATNQSGNLVWSWPSDAFGVGQPNNHGSTIDVVLRFPGQVADAHSGLYYNYFRDYDPQTGRYVESDPIGLNGGLNTYGYVGGNPLSFTDPYGLEAIQNTATIAGCGFGATLGATGGAALGGAGGLLCGPGALMCSPAAGAAMATGGAALGCAAGGAVGNVLGGAVETVIEWCTADDEDDTDKNCEALYQSILQTCSGLSGRKRMACFEAARESRDQCYRERGK